MKLISLSRFLQALGMLGAILETLSRFFRGRDEIQTTTCGNVMELSSGAASSLPETRLLDEPLTRSPDSKESLGPQGLGKSGVLK